VPAFDLQLFKVRAPIVWLAPFFERLRARRHKSARLAETHDDQALAHAALSDFNVFKVRLGHAAVRAGPARGHIGPQRAGGDTVLRSPCGLVVHKTTHDTNISFHENLQAMKK